MSSAAPCPTIWDSLLNLVISFLPMICCSFVNRCIQKMQEMGGAGGNAMLFGGGNPAQTVRRDDDRHQSTM
ncbi:MAG: hypothetical protein ACLUFT_09950 [Gemmiger formicilis]|uniref:hypothetical protein n=1 Tax=Gemmiger formicilis TaxID=745368 RepID=UPI0039937C32